MTYWYNIFGLIVKSDVILYGANMIPYDCKEDIRIVYAPDTLWKFDEVSFINRKHVGYLRSFQVTNGLLLSIDECIRIFIEDTGNLIIIDAREKDIKEASVAVCGTAMSVCMIFRNCLPLHAAGLVYCNSMFGILAESGTGKSTLLWSMINSGFKFATDDVIPVKISDNMIPYGIPSISLNSKLWLETIENLGMNPEKFTIRVFDEYDKYHVPIREDVRITESKELKCLFLLSPCKKNNESQVTIEQISGIEKFKVIEENTHAMWAAPQILKQTLFKIYSNLLLKTPIYVIKYDKKFIYIPQIIQIIKEKIAEEENR